jgi:hypothetical protein
MSKPTPKHPPAAPARPPGQGPPAEGARTSQADDEVLHVPRGVSRKTYLFLVFMIIFLMVIWLVPGSILGIAGGPTNPIIVRFQLPSGGQVEWRASDVQGMHRDVMDAFGVDFFLSMQLGVDASKPTPEELTRVLVLDRIAQDTGVEVSDADLAGHLREILDFQRATPEDFKNGVRARGLEVVRVERTIRMLLRVARFQQLVGFAGAVPDPAEIEEQWHEENVEFAFDYVTLPVADLEEEAKKELPDDAGLTAWFEELGEAEKEELETPEKRKAELALFRDVETTPATELLAAYPEEPAEGAAPTPPEELANQYHRRVYFRRFVRPKEPGAEAGGDLYFKFEEVKEQCLAEAPIYFAMQRWIEDLNARRTNGETIDLRAEAQELGLDHQAFLEPLTQEQFAADDAAGHADLADAIFATPPDGSFYASPFALAQGLAVVRANERVEPVLPPFESIRDQVAEKWLEPKSRELAQERLAAMRDGFERFVPEPEETEGEDAPPPPDEKPHHRASAEAFQAAAEAAGLAVKSRDYLNKAGPASKDPLADDEERRKLFSQAHSWRLYDLEADEVAEPGLADDEKTVYLVRLAGKRDVPIDDMTPAQYDRYEQNARTRAIQEVGRRMDLDFLRKHHALWLHVDSEQAKTASAGAAEAEQE